MAQKQSESHNLELKLEELESIIKKMESKQLTLEESLALFEKGVNLTKTCQKELVEAEQKVQQLIQSGNEAILTDFEQKS